ncbi:hypothetical protein [Streptosporangium sp. NPDC049078]|uniref:hypothetical protein n=1 Tax=Streptosporangium sp. NPDC049078 TaxID=3155767 RepID=UPI003439A50E
MSDLVLSPPEPVAKVPTEKAATMLPVPEGREAELAEKARGFAEELSGLDPRSPEFTRKVHDITSMGDSEIRASSQVANRMLKRPVAALASVKGEGRDAQAAVAGQLVALRRTIVDLDPKQTSAPARKLLGLIPFADRYFATTSRSTGRRRNTSTTSSAPSRPDRTSCARTTRPSRARRPTCGSR